MSDLKIGVVSIQGDVEEHLLMLEQAFEDLGIKGEVVLVRDKGGLDTVQGLIMPGGESTTISKLMASFGLGQAIKQRVAKGSLPVMGTCAGCILMAKHGDEEVKKTKTKLLGLMDIKVSRNSYGRQVDSFETPLEFSTKGPLFNKPFHAVFIRAPSILDAKGSEVLAEHNGEVVAARQGELLALTFHPELTGDSRIHQYFIQICRKLE